MADKHKEVSIMSDTSLEKVQSFIENMDETIKRGKLKDGEKPSNNIMRINVCLPQRIADTLPIGAIRTSYVRSALDILYLIQNSPVKNEILNHLGFKDIYNFDPTLFSQNYTESFIQGASENPKLQYDFDQLLQYAKILTDMFLQVANWFEEAKIGKDTKSIMSWDKWETENNKLDNDFLAKIIKQFKLGDIGE